jgi:hypothetical protein
MPSPEIQEFQIQLAVNSINEDLENDVFEAGCDDATLWSTEGVVYLSFHRESNDLLSAVRSALDELDEAGIPIAEIHAPLSIAEAS